MKRLLILSSVIIAFSTLTRAQSYERVYFNDATYEDGVVLSFVPNDTLTIKTESGEIKKFSMQEVRRIIKFFPELLEKDKPNQTIKGAISFSGGLFASRYNGSPYSVIFNPSFDFFMSTNFSGGLTMYLESFSDIFGPGNSFNKEGIVLKYFFGDEPDKAFLGLEGLVISDSDIVFETGITLGYNYAISNNLAVQPTFKISLLKEEGANLGNPKISIGARIASFIF